MIDIEYLTERFLANPVPYSISLAVILIALGVFFKLVGNPVVVIFQTITSLFPQAVREFTGGAGRAGALNFVIVILTFVLAVVLLVKPALLRFFEPETVASKAIGLMVFLTCVVVFIFSLRATLESEKMKGPMTPPKRDSWH